MRFLMLLITLMAMPAWAEDILASYAMKGGDALTIHYRDAKHVRVEINDDSFMLVDGDKVWMVNREGKQWTAIDMSQVGDMMQRFNIAGMSGMPDNAAEAAEQGGDVTFTRTDRTEAVAGYQGHVYEISDGRGKTREAVLTDHEDVVAASRAFLAVSANVAANMGMKGVSPEQLMQSLEGREETGLLRQGEDLTLTSLSAGSLPDSTFSLPADAKVQSIPKMPKNMPMPEGFSFPQ